MEEKFDESSSLRYSLASLFEPIFFPDRAVAVNLHIGDNVLKIGEFGVVHPVDLQKFGIRCLSQLASKSALAGAAAGKGLEYLSFGTNIDLDGPDTPNLLL
ncbi:hypothetical protein BJ170DRAFT_598581 [Xylariales sp. AK1849]|nr:hypothetical protein BJ170DRAFT_598581 [Xylariales sp. AK1849]